jgi:four helix bundle protein
MLPKYKYLLTYRYTEIIHDLTVAFCQTFLFNLDYRRTREQMIQAARSGKQNIIEGVGQGRTSKKGEIKLLGVAKASLDELLADYEDFLRQRKLNI